MPFPAGFQCAGCGEWNEIVVDESAGGRQHYVEDCQSVASQTFSPCPGIPHWANTLHRSELES